MDDTYFLGNISQDDWDRIIQIFKKHGMEVNLEKTKSFYKEYENMERVEKFKHLGVNLKDDGRISVEDMIESITKCATYIKRFAWKNPFLAHKEFHSKIKPKILHQMNPYKMD